MIYAVIDTNVLVSALLSKSDDSTISKVIAAIQAQHITTLYNNEILQEYRDVLAREKFHFPVELQSAMVESIVRHGINAERVPYIADMIDENDRVFYEVTLSKDSAYLVTGNAKHFPATSIVVTPAEMLEILYKQWSMK